MKYLPLLLKNLLRKKTRSFLTIAAVLLPLFVICIMGTMLRTLDSDPTGGHGMFRLITRHRVGWAAWIPEAYMERIRQVPGVKQVVRMNWFGGSYIDQSPRNQFARFTTSDAATMLAVLDEAKIVAGSADEWIKDRQGAIVGKLLMNKFGWKLGQKITIKGDIYPVNVELNIRGVFEAPDQTAIYFHHQYVEEALPRVKGWVGWYWMKAESAAAAQKIPPAIDAMFDNAPEPTRTETEKEMQNGFVSMLGNVRLMITSICLVIVGVILLIAANTMAMTARERVTEIAVMRTLGFPQRTILGLVLGESLLLALFGGGLGVALFVLFFPGFKTGLQNSPMGGFAAGMRIFPEILALGVAVTVLTGLVSGLVPAIRSAQRSIPDGLRQVG